MVQSTLLCLLHAQNFQITTMSPTVFYVVLLGTVLLQLLYISAGVSALSLLVHR